MPDSLPPWWRQKAWWIDHWVDVVGAVVLPLLLFFVSQKGQEAGDTLQRQSSRHAAADADNHQAIQLLADMGSRAGSDQLPQRRAMAQAVLEYANQGRLYHPSTVVAIDYLGRECDAETFQQLHKAVERALLVTPKSVDPSNEEYKKTDQTDRGNYDTQLLAAAEQSQAAACAAVNPAVAAVELPKISFFRQYVEVGCGATTSNSLTLPLSSEDQAKYQMADPKAYLEGISNLKSHSETATVAADHESAVVSYSIVGLDRQLFGNCPGGGHATLVVESHLQPKANVAQPAPAPAQK